MSDSRENRPPYSYYVEEMKDGTKEVTFNPQTMVRRYAQPTKENNESIG